MMLIAHLSDIHFGAEDAAAISYATQEVISRNPDLIIVSGDLTQRGKRVEFEAAAKWLDQFQQPIICTPGNHDVPMLNLVSRAHKTFSRFERHLGRYSKSQTINGILAQGINTARGWQVRKNWAEGSVDLDDLQNLLGGDERPAILTCHHPFLPFRDAPLKTRTSRGARASDLLANSSVELLLTGHVHKPAAQIIEAEKSAYLSISCGTLSSRLRSSPPSFNFIHVEEQSITMEIVDCSQPSTGRIYDKWDRCRLRLPTV